jgi:integrase/recombinase XerD
MEADPHFGSYLVAQGIGPRTVQTYQLVLARAVTAGLDLAHPSPLTVASYAESTPNSHSSRSQLRSTFRWYWQMLEVSGPEKAVRVPPQPLMVCRALEDDEARSVVKVALGWHPEGLATLLAMYLALRRAEIAVAEWERFDRNLGWYKVLGKGSKTASLPVHPILVEALATHRGSGYLFPGSRGRRHVTPTTVWLWVRKVCQEAGIDHVPPHRLRHTALATANDRLGDLRAVQTFARHSKPETTAGYTRTRLRQLQAVSDALDYLK